MTSLQEIIQRSGNPFSTFEPRSGNFWKEEQDANFTVNSIHQDELNQMMVEIERVAQNRQTRTIVIRGETASGKSYLLGRLKKQLNPKALFAYIGSWAAHDYIWRHTLRHTVDSLMETPEGQQESQLLLWMKGLSAFQEQSLRKKILGERGLFIQNFRGTYPVGIYRPKEFFGVLYDLTNPELYVLACDWLRGEDLETRDLRILGVRSSLESEYDAQNILSNFGKIAIQASYPIVLCFDQLDQALQPPNGQLGLQALLSVNTTIHNEKLKNFALIISILKQTWRENEKYLLAADKDRFDREIDLRDINLEQAEALWAKHLYPIHKQVKPKPKSPIEPLTRQDLETAFPSGKTQPRYVIQVGKKLIQEYKLGTPQVAPPDRDAYFQQIWDKELTSVQNKVLRVRQFSCQDLIKMLQQALSALQVKNIKSHFLTSKTYTSFSLSYQHPNSKQTVGVVWIEAPKLQSFFYCVQACKKDIKSKQCDTLFLIRSESLGQSGNKGYTLFQEIFNGAPHRHLNPHLDSVHYLATYSNLVKAAGAGELVVGYDTPNVPELEALVRESKELHKCTLLQELGIVPAKKVSEEDKDRQQQRWQDAKRYLVNLIKTQMILALDALVQMTKTQPKFDRLEEEAIQKIIRELEQEGFIKVNWDRSNPESSLVYLQPKN
jgi:GTPase SAR1 family protein